MKVRSLLADAAQLDPGGKVHVLGMGWTKIQTPLGAFALIALLDISPAEVTERYGVKCELLTETGELAKLLNASSEDEETLSVVISTNLVRNETTSKQDRITLPVIINFMPGINLEPGRYQWRLSVEGFQDAVALEPFEAIGPPPPAP